MGSHVRSDRTDSPAPTVAADSLDALVATYLWLRACHPVDATDDEIEDVALSLFLLLSNSKGRGILRGVADLRGYTIQGLITNRQGIRRREALNSPDPSRLLPLSSLRTPPDPAATAMNQEETAMVRRGLALLGRKERRLLETIGPHGNSSLARTSSARGNQKNRAQIKRDSTERTRALDQLLSCMIQDREMRRVPKWH